MKADSISSLQCEVNFIGVCPFVNKGCLVEKENFVCAVKERYKECSEYIHRKRISYFKQSLIQD